jgi:hypothetical protein
MSFAPTIDNLGISAQNLIARNVEELGLGYSYDYLSQREFDKWKLGFKRNLVVNHEFRNFVDLDYRHILDYLLGAMIAKKQFMMEFDGTMPFSGRFGMCRPRANFFGFGDDWAIGSSLTAGFDTSQTLNSINRFIHAGSTELGGTAGNAIRILPSAVHVIVGLGDLEPLVWGLDSPIEAFLITIDGKHKSNIPTDHQFAIAGFPVCELDEPIILKNKSTLLINLYCADLTDKNARAIPFPWGVSYAPEAQMRVPDPTNLDGTTNDMVTTS